MVSAQRDKDAFMLAGALGALAAALVHAVFDFNLHIYSNVHVLMLVIGVAIGGLYSSGHLRGRSVSKAGAWAFGLGGTAIALLLAAMSLQTLISYHLVTGGEKAHRLMNLSSAMSKYRAAAGIDPRNWLSHAGIARVLQTQSFWNVDADEKKETAREALGHYEAASRLNPLDMEVEYGMAQLHNALGDPETALRHIRRAVAHERKHPFYVTHLGIQLREMGRDEEALEVFRDAAKRWSTGTINLNIRLLEKKLAEKKAAASES
jgi:tetratricopeptide (TPR) repeat protein